MTCRARGRRNVGHAADLDALTHHDVLPDGTRVLMRPLRPEDAALYPEFIAHVTPEDSRLRFFAAIRELSEERIAELTHLDYEPRHGLHRDRRGDGARCSASCGCISMTTAAAANTP